VAKTKLWEKGFILRLDYIDKEGNLCVSWEKDPKEEYDIDTYVESAKDTLVESIVDWLNDNDLAEKFINNDGDNDRDIETFIENNGGDYYEMREDAMPDLPYDYDVCRLFAENYNTLSYNYKNVSGDDELANNLRYAIYEEIKDRIGDVSERVYTELCDKMNEEKENETRNV